MKQKREEASCVRQSSSRRLSPPRFRVSALAQDGYVVGITAALTGPPASTYAPAIEALRIYLDRVNAAGGINGRKVNLVIQDDSAEPSKAAANAKKLLTQDNAVLMINASLSSTYAPVVNEARNAGVPLLFAASVCPKDVYPPAAGGQFCTTAFASTFDSRAALSFIKETAKEPVKIGFAAMAIPLSRGEIDFAESQAGPLGMTAVDKEIIPPPTADYTPFATKIKDAGANWVFSWAPWVTQVRTFEALRRLGWTGDYLTWAHLEAEGELKRIKDGKLLVIGANALFDDNLPVQKEIADAVKTGGHQVSARADDRRVDRRHGDRSCTEGRRLADDGGESASLDAGPQGRPERPARRPDRVDQGQSLPHQAVLPRLSLGWREDRGGEGLVRLRREVSGAVPSSPAGAAQRRSPGIHAQPD